MWTLVKEEDSGYGGGGIMFDTPRQESFPVDDAFDLDVSTWFLYEITFRFGFI